jgi:Rieske [2Fe-2S] domain
MQASLPDLLVKNEHYLVACIPIPDKLAHLYLSLEDGWLPVLTPAHVDRETDIENIEGQLIEAEDALHYHIDVRFISSDLPIGGSIGVPVKSLAIFLDLLCPDSLNDEIEDLVELKRKKCYRVAVDDFDKSVVPSIYEPRAIEQGLILKDKNICPHQKTCLKGVPRHNNQVVCPAHGLEWNLTSGNLIPRRKRSNAIFGVAMIEEYRKMIELFDPSYFNNLAEENVKFEVWSRLPMSVFVYHDRLAFDADRARYS